MASNSNYQIAVGSTAESAAVHTKEAKINSYITCVCPNYNGNNAKNVDNLNCSDNDTSSDSTKHNLSLSDIKNRTCKFSGEILKLPTKSFNTSFGAEPINGVHSFLQTEFKK